MPTSKTRYILAGSCIDGSGAPARKDLLLTVQDGIITAINGRTDLPKQNGADIDDLSHCTLVPPLVDCNLALTRSPSMQPRQGAASAGIDLNEQIAQMQRHIRYLHDHGVLGAVDNDAKASLIVGLRARDAENALISLRSPHDPHTSFAWRQISPEITPPPQRNSEAVRDRHPQEKQQNRDKKLVVLANGPEQVTRALDEGCDAVVQGYGMGERNLRRMAAERVLWIPSLILAKNGLDSSGSGGDVCCRFSLSYVAPGQAQPGAKGYWQQLLAEQLEQLRLARELGVPTAAGTGAGTPGIIHGESLVEEIKLFIKAGFPLEEAIHSASEAGARFFSMARIGALQVGRPATFLVTRGTPHQLPRKLAYLENIYLNGIPSAAYRKNPVKVVHQQRVQQERQTAV
nr:amidohydrolase family protein [uncultured Desulfobulbus sp.]